MFDLFFSPICQGVWFLDDLGKVRELPLQVTVSLARTTLKNKVEIALTGILDFFQFTDR